MPQQSDLFAPADLATLEGRARAEAARLRRRCCLDRPRKPSPTDCPDHIARAHLDTLHALLDDTRTTP